MCEGERGGGTMACQRDFHFLSENPAQALQPHSSNDGALFWGVCYKTYSCCRVLFVYFQVLLGGGWDQAIL